MKWPSTLLKTVLALGVWGGVLMSTHDAGLALAAVCAVTLMAPE